MLTERCNSRITKICAGFADGAPRAHLRDLLASALLAHPCGIQRVTSRRIPVFAHHFFVHDMKLLHTSEIRIVRSR
ncbi:hypothetical protein Shyhy01_16500 [Streptomyces hygroscopicus subsp. hygroscopicus]|nr:hypothetical protein Shyhy01_16500 [Streptomyces hygroscopicus subsp. hygroscopicus]